MEMSELGELTVKARSSDGTIKEVSLADYRKNVRTHLRRRLKERFDIELTDREIDKWEYRLTFEEFPVLFSQHGKTGYLVEIGGHQMGAVMHDMAACWITVTPPNAYPQKPNRPS